MTVEQLQAQLKALQEQNAALTAKLAVKQTVTVKANLLGDGDGKGTVSVYGLGRFPVTLYPGQWEKLLAKAEDITATIKANHDKLAWK